MRRNDNMMTYKLWLVHKDNWQGFIPAVEAKTRAYHYCKHLQQELGLEFMRISQPVDLNGLASDALQSELSEQRKDK
jgi:hypothetical protein